MKRYRLTARAQMNGAPQEPGYVFVLAEGEKGPHRTMVASNHGTHGEIHGRQISDQDLKPGALIDVPLYEEIHDHDVA